MNAQFSIKKEQLTYRIGPHMGEADSFTVYPDPDVKVLEHLRRSRTGAELWDNLPTKLEYNI